MAATAPAHKSFVFEQVDAVFVNVVVVGDKKPVNLFTDIVDTPVFAIDVYVHGPVGLFVDIDLIEQSGHEGVAKMRFAKIAAAVAQHHEFDVLWAFFTKKRMVEARFAEAFAGYQGQGFLGKKPAHTPEKAHAREAAVH